MVLKHINLITEQCFVKGWQAQRVFLCVKRRVFIMPRNQFQKMFFAFVTVVITVHAYVFYSLYVVNGSTLMEVNGTSSVLAAIQQQGGVYMLGKYLPIWAVVIAEFCLAYGLELVLGSPMSFKIASRIVNPKKTHHMVFETLIICATVLIMCPAMSFLAAILYYPYYSGFHVATLLANWLKLVCFNFPFAIFSQIFFIQPCVRAIFRLVFLREKQTGAKRGKLGVSAN